MDRSMEPQPNDLFFYAAEGSLADLERIVKSHKDWLQHRDARGRDALMHAAIADNYKNFQFLHKKGLSLWERDSNGAIVLHWAAQCRAYKVVRHILQNSTGQELFLVKDKDGVTALHIAAAQSCNKMLKLFLEFITPNDNIFEKAQDKRGRSPLHYAASRASVECVATILDSSVLGLTVDQKDKHGVTPLMCAVGVVLPPAIDVCRLLAQRKMLAVSARNKFGHTALHLAVAAYNISVVKLLVEELKCQVEVRYISKMRTPLHYAAEQDQSEIVQLLLAYGAKNSTKDHFGVTPAHYAAQFSRTCLETIFATTGITEVKDRQQRSCLMWAVCAGNIEVIEFLVKRTAPERHDMDIHGFTALHLAAMVGNENVCKVLVKQGWNISERDKQDNTPLHLAAGRGNTDVVRFLVTSGANINDKDTHQRTPIFWACFGGQSHTLYCMIKEMSFQWRTTERPARPVTDALGRTPLHAAAFAGSAACINMMLGIEAEDDCLSSPLIGWKDNDGETALHVACERGHMACVLSLLKGGAAINALNKRGLTPLECAQEHKAIRDHLQAQRAMTRDELVKEAALTIWYWWKWRVKLRRKANSAYL
ncbi:unnamed protein product [Auanema sp. JU1783]|nr:unnamed protein product [Auanema sp. JU1783]